METDELIAILAHVPPTHKPLRLNIAALLMVLVVAAATIVLLGIRPEFKAMQLPVSFWIKTEMLAVILSIALQRLILASKPLTTPQMPWVEILLAIVMLLLVEHEWMTFTPRIILNGFLLPNFPSCLICVTVYGLISMGALTLLMRHYAPADTRQCAGLIGFTAAATGAVGYSIHCPLDSPTFVVVAYGLPMLALWTLGRMVLPRLIKW